MNPCNAGRLTFGGCTHPLEKISASAFVTSANFKPITPFTATFLFVKAGLWLLCVAVAMWKPEHGIHDDIAKTRWCRGERSPTDRPGAV